MTVMAAVKAVNRKSWFPGNLTEAGFFCVMGNFVFHYAGIVFCGKIKKAVASECRLMRKRYELCRSDFYKYVQRYH